MAISGVAVGLTWEFLYQPQLGIVDEVIRLIGFHNFHFAWLANSRAAIWAVVISVSWQYFGYHLLIFTAGMSTVPGSLIDAAKVTGPTNGDGDAHRGAAAETLHPVSLILITTSSIASFANVIALTDGGPGYSSTVLSLEMYQNAMFYSRYGYGSAIAVDAHGYEYPGSRLHRLGHVPLAMEASPRQCLSSPASKMWRRNSPRRVPVRVHGRQMGGTRCTSTSAKAGTCFQVCRVDPVGGHRCLPTHLGGDVRPQDRVRPRTTRSACRLPYIGPTIGVCWSRTALTLIYSIACAICVLATIAVTILTAMAAYPLSRMQWKLRKVVVGYFGLGLIVPIYATLIPLYIMPARSGACRRPPTGAGYRLSGRGHASLNDNPHELHVQGAC